MRKLAVLGLVLAVVGGGLALGFWPLTSVSGAKLAAALASDGTYTGYAVGSRITIREKVVDVQYTEVFGTSIVELEDGNPGVDTAVAVRGDARPVALIGSYIYTSAVLQEFITFQYWEVSTPADIHPSLPVDAAFYGLAGLGVVLLVVAALRRPAPPKQV